MNSALDNKVAWITGGGSGLGAGVALGLAESGVTVFISGRTQADLDTIANQHKSVSGLRCDVTDRSEVDAACSVIKDTAGRLDIVVANAGYACSAPFATTSEKNMQTLWEVNVLGVFHVWQAALALVNNSSDGRLIAISSVAGLRGYPYVSGYCATKHAVIGLMKSVALELAKTGTTVNAICPGYIDTPMLDRTISNIVEKTGSTAQEAKDALLTNNPQKRFITVEEVTAQVLWLCQPAARSINGQALSVCGGET